MTIRTAQRIIGSDVTASELRMFMKAAQVLLQKMAADELMTDLENINAIKKSITMLTKVHDYIDSMPRGWRGTDPDWDLLRKYEDKLQDILIGNIPNPDNKNLNKPIDKAINEHPQIKKLSKKITDLTNGDIAETKLEHMTTRGHKQGTVDIESSVEIVPRDKGRAH